MKPKRILIVLTIIVGLLEAFAPYATKLEFYGVWFALLIILLDGDDK